MGNVIKLKHRLPMKIYTQTFPKPNKQPSNLAIDTQGPRQSTLDAIMAFARTFNPPR